MVITSAISCALLAPASSNSIKFPLLERSPRSKRSYHCRVAQHRWEIQQK